MRARDNAYVRLLGRRVENATLAAVGGGTLALAPTTRGGEPVFVARDVDCDGRVVRTAEWDLELLAVHLEERETKLPARSAATLGRRLGTRDSFHPATGCSDDGSGARLPCSALAEELVVSGVRPRVGAREPDVLAGLLWTKSARFPAAPLRGRVREDLAYVSRRQPGGLGRRVRPEWT